MASTDTFTTVSVDHEKGEAVAVTIDGDNGAILHIERAKIPNGHVKPTEGAQGLVRYD